MLSIRLPEEIETRLNTLAKETGRTKSHYVRQLILEHIEDLEDIHIAEQVLEDIRAGRDVPTSGDEFWANLKPR